MRLDPSQSHALEDFHGPLGVTRLATGIDHAAVDNGIALQTLVLQFPRPQGLRSEPFLGLGTRKSQAQGLEPEHISLFSTAMFKDRLRTEPREPPLCFISLSGLCTGVDHGAVAP